MAWKRKLAKIGSHSSETIVANIEENQEEDPESKGETEITIVRSGETNKEIRTEISLIHMTEWVKGQETKLIGQIDFRI